MIPPFDASGRLPEGIHPASWEEFAARFAWNNVRMRQFQGLKLAALSLAEAGCTRLYADGSYVTAKEEPGDFDACWDEEGVEQQLIDPVLLDFSNRRAAQQAKYRGATFPAHLVTDSGITVLEGQQMDYHTGQPKGIVVLNPQELKGGES
jgi:hypothetical protein